MVSFETGVVLLVGSTYEVDISHKSDTQVVAGFLVQASISAASTVVDFG